MILDAFRLDGRVALVTGASRGLGQAIALGLAEAGADIVGLDRSPEGETSEKVTALGRKFYDVQCDLLTVSAQDVEQIITDIVSQFGRLDILVNNAGIIRREDLLNFSETDWNDVLQINLSALFYLSQSAGRVMEKQATGGKIINIASMLSFQGGIRVPAYTATKSAVAGLTRAFANELAHRNINVNAIAPGYMATDNTAQLRADEARQKAILERIPAARWGTPDDLKGMAVFLASDASAYMHGAIIPVDGGWLAR
jgi:2-deoxy-D-gluconate 3-dehydrogenase